MKMHAVIDRFAVVRSVENDGLASAYLVNHLLEHGVGVQDAVVERIEQLLLVARGVDAETLGREAGKLARMALRIQVV